MGLENIWQVRVTGDSQVFQKDEANSVYGVTVLKNVLWPGWVTVGYVLIYLFRKEASAVYMLVMGTSGHKTTGAPTTTAALGKKHNK